MTYTIALESSTVLHMVDDSTNNDVVYDRQ